MTSTTPDSTVPDTTDPDAAVPDSQSTDSADTRSHVSGTPRHRPVRHFLRHFAEMTIAMVIGMLLFGPVWRVLATALDAASGLDLNPLLDHPDIGALVMATNMTLAMTVWMRYRAHGWAPVAEMGAAMYLPFLLFLPPYWMGAVSGEFLMMAGHVLMLPAMVLAMLRRVDEYSGHPGTPALRRGPDDGC
ncbi:hypothetical protein ABNF97_26270 [Plantactinospora sp. B6F1]|uniref:hypothetical protein n=1 Tax=Plantactinospora sp. B6F1 TaxID=3158971 RepID=UPI0032D8D4AF